MQHAYDALHADRPWHDGKFQTFTTERTAGTPIKYDDGVTLYVAATDENPDDEFLKPIFLIGGDDDGGPP